MNTVLSLTQVSLVHPHVLPDHSVPKHLTHSRRRFITLPLSATGFPPLGSGLRLSHAGSSAAPGRIEFVILRTGRSPPAALHHASLRRSSSWLQAGERLPGEDFHLSERARSQARVRWGFASPAPLFILRLCLRPTSEAQPQAWIRYRKGRAFPHGGRQSRKGYHASQL